jgi:ribonuclease HII
LENILWGKGHTHIAGIDEAGRGALAGPVIAAAVVLPGQTLIAGLNDSKRLKPAERERLFSVITYAATGLGVGRSAPDVIDQKNIRQANLLAMREAVDTLPSPPEHLLIDGIDTIDWPGEQTTVVGGDAKSLSIAAASIIAKVTRDRIMVSYDQEYPEYGFAKHKGYGTAKHLDALKIFGMCPIHRRSFRWQRPSEKP